MEEEEILVNRLRANVFFSFVTELFSHSRNCEFRAAQFNGVAAGFLAGAYGTITYSKLMQT
jgi:hypothetical protein